jgi:hypothetical protein
VPTNYYPNATEAELVSLLESLQRRATMGQIYMTTYAGDQQMRSFQGGSPIRVEMKHVLYSLSLLNDDYTNPWTNRVRRTRSDFSQ